MAPQMCKPSSIALALAHQLDHLQLAHQLDHLQLTSASAPEGLLSLSKHCLALKQHLGRHRQPNKRQTLINAPTALQDRLLKRRQHA